MYTNWSTYSNIVKRMSEIAYGIMDDVETFNNNLQKEKYVHNYANDNVPLLITNFEDKNVKIYK